MRVLLQKVKEVSVTVAGEEISRIGRGYLLLVGLTREDTDAELDWMARKVAGLRVFEDEDEKLNLSIQDVGGEVLAVSQFTLYGDARKGRRPSFVRAAPGDEAEPKMDRFCDKLRDEGLTVREGAFGRMMEVALVNDGPVTLMLEKESGD